ncbi:2Fe-2S iron-sulfur cluster-binding protein [Pseudomaricurvus sp. HS19]|uniref:2Fe-2S iron-sulfur cluster-binding protein n=1 Tax=Pseudomaricurvus sp. HS19 TaxID=2692626 RepID=UPI001369D4E4|nr:2Fe-2S iron-sulfur cluster binding domain-containing protein [Pseudomaricurvus sp. HS19]
MSVPSMSFLITIRQTQAADLELRVDGNETLLEAMRRQELPVRKACRNGGCGVCRCQLVSGDIDYGARYPHGLWQADIEQGVILPCIASARSDLVLSDLSFEQSRRR